MYGLLHNSKAERTSADIENPPKSHPPLSAGAEPCGPASAQVFAGEDMGREARLMAQKQQLRDWYEQQVFEKNIGKELHKHDDDIFTAQNNAAAENLLEVEKAETAMRAELEHSRQEYNQFMESSKRALKFEQQDRDVLEGLVHVENQLQSDFLNECTPHQGNGKILFTEYKGEPKGGDSLDQMIMSREAQLEAKAEVEKAKKKEEKAFVRQQEMVRRTLIESQMKEKRKQREMQEQIVRENMAIAAGRKAKDAYAQHSMYTNECSDLFWSQFGTSTR
jgi:preprotein translocase subunit SecD